MLLGATHFDFNCYYLVLLILIVTLCLLSLISLSLQLFPQLEQPILHPLRDSLEHYERLKMVDDLKLEEASRRVSIVSGHISLHVLAAANMVDQPAFQPHTLNA